MSARSIRGMGSSLKVTVTNPVKEISPAPPHSAALHDDTTNLDATRRPSTANASVCAAAVKSSASGMFEPWRAMDAHIRFDPCL